MSSSRLESIYSHIVIPNPIDQNPWAHWRSPMDMMRQGWSLDFVKVPKREKAEVLAAFAAHKDEVTAGYVGAKRG